MKNLADLFNILGKYDIISMEKNQRRKKMKKKDHLDVSAIMYRAFYGDEL